MIKSSEALSMSEAVEYMRKPQEDEVDVAGFVKKFVSLNSKEAKELRSKLDALDLMKLKGEHISKIIDLMPDDSEAINKIFVDVSLSEDETKNILDTVKEFK